MLSFARKEGSKVGSYLGSIFNLLICLRIYFWIKVSAIRSRVLERNGLAMNRGSDTRNEKGIDKCPIKS